MCLRRLESLRHITKRIMPSILGVDAAWTATQPSGVALVQADHDGLRLVRVARAYAEFTALDGVAPADWTQPVTGGPPDWPALLAACATLTARPPAVVTLDMPIGPRPITGRRAADNAVARAYAGRWAAPHTPTAERPGPIADTVYRELTALGYRWVGAEAAAPPQEGVSEAPYFIEVYPHPAIIELMGLDKRLTYKVAHQSRYARATGGDGWALIVASLDRLRAALADTVQGVEAALPSAAALPRRALKGLEDALDAVVCAWVGAEFLAGRALAYGDADSAIWIPAPTGS